MTPLDNLLLQAVSAFSNPGDQKRLRYGLQTFLSALGQLGRPLDLSTLFSADLASLFHTGLNLSPDSSRARAAEVRRLIRQLVETGQIQTPSQSFTDLGYPSGDTIWRTRGLWKAFSGQVLLNRISPDKLTSAWLSSFLDELRASGKLLSRKKYDAFRSEWQEWKGKHGLLIPELPEWVSKQPERIFHWEDLPPGVRLNLEEWLVSSTHSDSRCRKGSSIAIYRNLLERYLRFLTGQIGGLDLHREIRQLFSVDLIHQFLSESKESKVEGTASVYRPSLKWEAAAFIRLLRELGDPEGASRLKIWFKAQKIAPARVRSECPSFSGFLHAAEEEFAQVISHADAARAGTRVRNALLFLDAVLFGLRPQDLVSRTQAMLREQWPESLQGLLNLLFKETGSSSAWRGHANRPLSAVSIRCILQQILSRRFPGKPSPKSIETAWLDAYWLDHPSDILTPSSHLGQGPSTIHHKQTTRAARAAVKRIDQSLGGNASC